MTVFAIYIEKYFVFSPQLTQSNFASIFLSKLDQVIFVVIMLEYIMRRMRQPEYCFVRLITPYSENQQ